MQCPIPIAGCGVLALTAVTAHVAYDALSRAVGVPVLHIFEGVATRPELNQGDGLHPTKEGVAVIVENILPSLVALLDNQP